MENYKAFGDARRAAKKARQHYGRRVEAEQRQEASKKLTPEQKLAKLDFRLGKGVGANKERKRLKQQMEGKK